MEKEYKVKSLAKAMRLLECFTSQKPELGITEIANMLDIQKSSVHNMISTFEDMGYVSQNKETGKYYLGVKLLQFSYIVNNHIGIRKYFLPYMKQIANELHETVFLGIPHELEVLYIESAYPDESNGGRSIMGEKAPMYCTGLGKAMLAYLPNERLEACVNGQFIPFTERTLTSGEELRRDVEDTRARGYAIDNMEHEYGVKCLGMPVFGNDNRVVAAISISGPSLRFENDTLDYKAKRMQEILRPAQYKL